MHLEGIIICPPFLPPPPSINIYKKQVKNAIKMDPLPTIKKKLIKGPFKRILEIPRKDPLPIILKNNIRGPLYFQLACIYGPKFIPLIIKNVAKMKLFSDPATWY
jgi:hypothetical protein